jgi:rod shape-determining protein MreB
MPSTTLLQETSMSFNRLRTLIKQDLAVDLGTANTLIYAQGEGIVLNNPTVIALSDDGRVIEVGLAARKYLGRTPAGVRALRPMKDGVIADFYAMSQLIRAFLDRAQGPRGVLSPRVVICVPSNITQVEKRTVLEAAREAGVKKVYLIEEIMAAAIGAGIPAYGAEPHMVVDIGGGTTEVAVLAQWAYLHCETIRVAGDEMDEAVAFWFADNYSMELGPTTAETVKWKIGSAWDQGPGQDSPYRVAGKDFIKGVPTSVHVTPRQLRPAFREPLKAIWQAIHDVLSAVDVKARLVIEANGITVTGGGALLGGMTEFLEDRIGVPFSLAPDPLTTVVLGAGRTVEDFKTYEKIFIN